MPAAFPHHYQVEVSAPAGGSSAGELNGSAASSVSVGPPPQFDGAPGRWSPEDLLLGAIASCHMTTLMALAQRKGVSVSEYRAQARGVLNKTRTGLRFTEIALEVSARAASGQAAVLEELMKQAEGFCIVSNALAIDVQLSTEVRA